MVNKYTQINTSKRKRFQKQRPIKDPKQFDDNWDRIFGKKKNDKDKSRKVEDYLPFWKGKLDYSPIEMKSRANPMGRNYQKLC